MSNRLYHLAIVFFCLTLASCASVVRNPLPEQDHLDVTVLGMKDIRHWGDGVRLRAFPGIENRSQLEQSYGGIMHREHNYLVISGGGANGAYGAGVLKAWSELGNRPEFTIVTGVSTGALISPFAFLGEEYDDELERLYTTLDTTQILNTRSFFALFGADSLVDTSPLSRVLEQVVDDDMVAALAREHAKGRILVVGTTNMDAGRPVAWNLTRIAASGHPDSAKLIRQVLKASSAIPGAFPPVYIKVETPDGRTYDEMHGDGGAATQMFLYPAGLNWKQVLEVLDVQGTPHIYLVRNAYIHPAYQTVEPRLLPIAGRTIDSLIRTQGVGDFFRINQLAERDGLDLDVTWIPGETRSVLGTEQNEAFDPEYMKALFEYGYNQTLNGDTWKDFSDMMESVDLREIPED